MIVKELKNYVKKENQNPKIKSDFQIGEVVLREEGVDENGNFYPTEIGVIIQVLEKNKFITDVFGVCTSKQLRTPTKKEIYTFRPTISIQIKKDK
jgi:hypothetical protein